MKKAEDDYYGPPHRRSIYFIPVNNINIHSKPPMRRHTLNVFLRPSVDHTKPPMRRHKI